MNAIVKSDESAQDWENKKDLIKRTICKGASDEELELFVHTCKRTGLDPFMKQIYAVKRWSSADKKEVMALQTSIDGFRVIAERTGRYAPGRESEFKYDDKGFLISATSFVKKQTLDGTWHEVAATAFWDEYCQKSKEGKVTQFWEKMPHVMLAKCAESLALRKAFPAELSGLYTSEEMSQASKVEQQDHIHESVEMVEPKVATISTAQAIEIENLLKGRADLKEKLLKWADVDTIEDLPFSKYSGTMKAIDNHLIKEGSLV